jgi:hypothetical protein
MLEDGRCATQEGIDEIGDQLI